MKEAVISMMYTNKDFRDLNILVQNNEEYKYHIKTQDRKMNITFDVEFRAILMGEDTGSDVLINFVDFLEMLDSSRHERLN